MTDLDARVRAAAERLINQLLIDWTTRDVQTLGAWPPFRAAIEALAGSAHCDCPTCTPRSRKALRDLCGPAGAETRQSLPGGSPPDTTKKADSAPAVENTS